MEKTSIHPHWGSTNLSGSEFKPKEFKGMQSPQSLAKLPAESPRTRTRLVRLRLQVRGHTGLSSPFYTAACQSHCKAHNRKALADVFFSSLSFACYFEHSCFEKSQPEISGGALNHCHPTNKCRVWGRPRCPVSPRT